MDYKEKADNIIDYVGGKENIKTFTHCATRLRFQLKDASKVDKEAIQKDKDLVGFVEAQGQSQIIVGTEVPKVYDALQTHLSGSDDQTVVSGTMNDSDEVDEVKKSLLDRILATISAIFTPYIPVLASAGIIKGLIAILSNFQLLSEKSDTYAMFNGIGNALIYFFPILLAFTAAKQFKANPYIGATIGAALLEPNIATITETGNKMNLFGINIVAQNFASTVIPIIIAMYFYAKLEHFSKKYIPQKAQLMLVPVICLIVIVPLTLMVFGPLGFAMANAVVAVYKFLLSTNMILFQTIFGGFFIFVIMFGVHWVLLPMQLQILADQGKEYSLASGGLGGYALLGVCLAVFIIAKNKSDKEMAGSAAFVNGLSGITEPGLYGVMIKNKKYILSVILGGLAGGFVHGVTGTYITNFAFGGLLGVPAFLSSPKAATYFLGVLVSIVVGFISTVILTKREQAKG